MFSIVWAIALPIIILVCYATISYLFNDYIGHKNTNLKYDLIDKETRFREQQRERSLTSTYKRVKEATDNIMKDFDENNNKMANAIERLDGLTVMAEDANENISKFLLEEPTVNQLTAELKQKTDQLTKITEEYEALKQRFTQAVNKIEEELISLKQVKQERWGGAEGTDKIFDLFNKMKSHNVELRKSLETRNEQLKKDRATNHTVDQSVKRSQSNHRSTRSRGFQYRPYIKLINQDFFRNGHINVSCNHWNQIARRSATSCLTHDMLQLVIK